MSLDLQPKVVAESARVAKPLLRSSYRRPSKTDDEFRHAKEAAREEHRHQSKQWQTRCQPADHSLSTAPCLARVDQVLYLAFNTVDIGMVTRCGHKISIFISLRFEPVHDKWQRDAGLRYCYCPERLEGSLHRR